MINSGDIKLGDNERLRLVGHSMGAAYVAGMASILANSQYAHLLDFVDYLAPLQPGKFKHPKGILGRQMVSATDMFAGQGKRITDVDDYYSATFGSKSDFGGHTLNSNLNDFIQRCINAGVPVTVYE